MNRTINVVRLQLVNKQTFVWVPLIVLFGALALSLAVYALIRSGGADGPMYGGGAQAPLWYFLVVGVQSLTLTFPFSQAMSVTRREFYLGTLLTALLSAAILASIFVVGGVIETATDGYGMQGYFFSVEWLWSAGWWAAWLGYFMIAMLMFVAGFWAATIYKRWGSVILTVVLVAVGVALVALMWLIGRMDAWAQVFAWFAQQGTVGLTLWGLLLAAVLAGISYLTLRRATP